MPGERSRSPEERAPRAGSGRCPPNPGARGDLAAGGRELGGEAASGSGKRAAA